MIISETETLLPTLNMVRKGKVRDVYDLGKELLIVATDRISAYDVVMDEPIPEKGKILTQISKFWFNLMEDIVPNHFITDNVDEYPEVCRQYKKVLEGRSMLVKKAEPLPVECIVRGYLSGSGWASYKKDQSVCGIGLPEGLEESIRLPTPLFTPSTKADDGEHDINISFDEVIDALGMNIAIKLKEYSISIYNKGYNFALDRGIIIADTKFEFGVLDDEIILIDEVLTPDSSRFWDIRKYKSGTSQDSFDKQFLRDYLNSTGWDKEPPPPKLPQDVIKGTYNKYMLASQLIIE